MMLIPGDTLHDEHHPYGLLIREVHLDRERFRCSWTDTSNTMFYYSFYDMFEIMQEGWRLDNVPTRR